MIKGASSIGIKGGEGRDWQDLYPEKYSGICSSLNKQPLSSPLLHHHLCEPCTDFLVFGTSCRVFISSNCWDRKLFKAQVVWKDRTLFMSKKHSPSTPLRHVPLFQNAQLEKQFHQFHQWSRGNLWCWTIRGWEHILLAPINGKPYG